MHAGWPPVRMPRRRGSAAAPWRPSSRRRSRRGPGHCNRIRERPASAAQHRHLVDHHRGEVQRRAPAYVLLSTMRPPRPHQPCRQFEALRRAAALDHHVPVGLAAPPARRAWPGCPCGRRTPASTRCRPITSSLHPGRPQHLGDQQPQPPRADHGDPHPLLDRALLDDLERGRQRLDEHGLLVADGVRHRVQVPHRHGHLVGERPVAAGDAQHRPPPAMVRQPAWHMSHLPQTQLISATTRLPCQASGPSTHRADELVPEHAGESPCSP